MDDGKFDKIKSINCTNDYLMILSKNGTLEAKNKADFFESGSWKVINAKTTITDVHASENSYIILTQNQKILAWTNQDTGQFGNLKLGGKMNFFDPQKIKIKLDGDRIEKVVGGKDFLAILASNKKNLIDVFFLKK